MRYTIALPIFAAALAGCSNSELAEPITLETEVASSQESLSCSFNREFDFSGNWSFTQLASSTIQEASIEADGMVHTVSPIWVGGQHHDTLLTSVNCSGGVVARRLGMPGTDEEGHAMVLSHDGLHAIITGRAEENLWVTKVRLSDGAVQWSQRIGQVDYDEVGESIARLEPDVVGANDYIIAGHMYLYVGGINNLYAVRISDNGVVRWDRHYQVNSDNHEHAGMILRDGMAYLSTNSQTPATADRVYSIFEVRVADGTSPTAHYYPSPALPQWNNTAVQVPRLTLLRNNEGYIASYSTRNPDAKMRASLLRLDDNFDVVWEKSYTGTADTRALAAWPYRGRFLLSNASDGASAMLLASGTGAVIHNRRYQAPTHNDDVTPATQLGPRWLLRTVSDRTLALRTLGGPTTSCAQSVSVTDVDVVRQHVTHAPLSAPWGVVSPHPVAVIQESPIYFSDVCVGGRT